MQNNLYDTAQFLLEVHLPDKQQGGCADLWHVQSGYKYTVVYKKYCTHSESYAISQLVEQNQTVSVHERSCMMRILRYGADV